jgi:hypothetical protein
MSNSVGMFVVAQMRSASGSENVSFPGKTGSDRHTGRMTRMTPKEIARGVPVRACASARTASASNSLESVTSRRSISTSPDTSASRRHFSTLSRSRSTSCIHFWSWFREPAILKGPSNFGMLRAWIAASQLPASRRRLFRHQPIFHVCGNAKLSCFSDGFGSLQSGRQPFGLCQSLGCPGSPIVTIEIVARQFCHVIVFTVALSGRYAPSQ